MRFAKLSLVAAAVASLVSLSSCADEQESLIVAGAPVWNMGCSVQVPTDVFLSQGVLDLKFQTDYMLPLQVENQLAQQSADASNSGTDNSEMQLVGADVSLSMPQRPEIIEQLEARNGAFVEFSPNIPTDSIPGNGTRGVIVPAIPAATAIELGAIRVAEATAAGESAVQAYMAENDDAGDGELEAVRFAAEQNLLLRDETIVIDVTLRARRTGNSKGNVGEFESRAYSFPVQVCFGCLLSCSSCQIPLDDDGDGSTDRTLDGVCPGSVPTEPTARLNANSFLSSIGCPTAQDAAQIPNSQFCDLP